MKDVCNSIMTYHKSDVNEIIDIGDIVMLNPETNTITKAVINDDDELAINARLVIGVVVYSDNFSKVPIIIDGGRARDRDDSITRSILDCGTSKDKPEFIILEGGTSKQNMRELVKIAYEGQVPVNLCGYAQLGDRLTISDHAGKAQSINYIDNDYFKLRSIGKVIKYISKYQAKVLLDIE